MSMNVFKFESRADAEIALMEDLLRQLGPCVQSNGECTLLLSGGSTPAGLYRRMNEADFPWPTLSVGLVDERRVADDHPASNAALIQQTFLSDHADVRFFPMVYEPENLEKDWDQIAHNYETLPSDRWVVLGMGGDGHTASLFPGDPASEQTFMASHEHPPALAQTTAPNAPTQRITCTPAYLKTASHVFLLMFGEEKWNVWENASAQNLPIWRVMNASRAASIYYAP